MSPTSSDSPKQVEDIYFDDACPEELQEGFEAICKEAEYHPAVKSIGFVASKDGLRTMLSKQNSLCIGISSPDRLKSVCEGHTYQEGHIFTIVIETYEAHRMRLANEMSAQLRVILGLDTDTTENLLLALTEALNNAVEHGNLQMSDLKKDISSMSDMAADYFKIFEDRLNSDEYGKKLIKISCWRQHLDLFISVKDEGGGFKPQDVKYSKDNIVVPSGRGINILEQITSRLLYSNGGRCVTFGISLPAVVEDYTATSPEAVRENGSILVVDDQVLNRQLAAHFLHRAGFKNVMQADGGKDALRVVREKRPDLILLDIVMPDVDGFEVCKKLKNNPHTSQIPIIFMSALSSVENRTKGYELGAVDYINKPIEYNEMLARAEVHIKNGMLMHRLHEYSSRVRNDLEQARTFQIDLLPKSKEIEQISKDYHLKVESEFKACEELAGDYWFSFPLDENKLALTVLDFSGHGVISALNTVKLHSVINEIPTETLLEPEKTMFHINDRLHEFLKTGHFATAVYGVYDKEDKTFTYSSAGSPPFAVLRDNKEVEFASCDGVPLGLISSDKITYPLQEVKLKAGDEMLFYSDALTEGLHQDGHRWDDEGLVESLKGYMKQNVKSMVEYVLDNFFATAIQPVKDDLTLLGLTIK